MRRWNQMKNPPPKPHITLSKLQADMFIEVYVSTSKTESYKHYPVYSLGSTLQNIRCGRDSGKKKRRRENKREDQEYWYLCTIRIHCKNSGHDKKDYSSILAQSNREDTRHSSSQFLLRLKLTQ